MYTFEDRPQHLDPKIQCVAAFSVFKDKILKTLVMIFAREKPNTYYVCGEGKGQWFEGTLEGAVSFAKAQYDPFQDAIAKIHAQINKSVAEAKHKTDLRIAQFRGFLFDQGIKLKNGYDKEYIDHLYDLLFHELDQHGVVGKINLFNKYFHA